MHFLILDTETTGLPTSKDYTNLAAFEPARLLELALVVISPLDQLQPVAQYSSLVKPVGFQLPVNFPFPLPDLATFQEQGHDLGEVLTQLAQYCHDDTVLVGHNIEFDLNIIKSELVRLLSSGVTSDVPAQQLLDYLNHCATICTMTLATNRLKLASKTGSSYKWPKLSELYYHCTGQQPLVSHRAMADVMTTVVCFYVMWYRGWLPIQLGRPSELSLVVS